MTGHMIYVIYAVGTIFFELYWVLRLQKKINDKGILSLNIWHFVELLFGQLAKADMYLCICFFVLCLKCIDGVPEEQCAAVENIYDPTISPLINDDEQAGQRLLYGLGDRLLAATSSIEPCCIPWSSDAHEEGYETDSGDHRLLNSTESIFNRYLAASASAPTYCCVPYDDLKEEHRVLSRILAGDATSGPPPCCIPYDVMAQA